ncbi:hypothetical protein BJ741DRAFT_625829 [Chytriomyces cf. hyalinus JEL632]|nr:hypothetical protein BJ741DRAFT_625829 [Chytriomyces cf. hyalinus JEL632]
MRAKCRVELTMETSFLHPQKRTSRIFSLPKVFSRALLERLEITKDTDNPIESDNREFLDDMMRRISNAKKEPTTPSRIESLDKVFNLIISRFTSHKLLLAEVKREYDLILGSLTNHANEKEYLRSKIQKLICEVGTPEMLNMELGRVMALSFRLDAVQSVNDGLKREHDDQDMVFIKTLGELFEEELEGTSNETHKMSLKFKGKKAYISDWFTANSTKSDLLQCLAKKFKNGDYDELDEVKKPTAPDANVAAPNTAVCKCYCNWTQVADAVTNRSAKN